MTKNHRIFTLRCIDRGIILVSVRLRSENSKLSKSAKEIIYKAEKQLLQDRVGCINVMLEDNRNSINRCMAELVSMVTTLDRDKCSKFIQMVSEARFTKVKEGQVRKLNSLINKTSNNNNGVSARSKGSNNNKGSCNNSQMQGIQNSNNNQTGIHNNSKWVINLSTRTLTKGQELLSAKGPNFALASDNIPSVDYITAVKSICPKLRDQDAQELRADTNSLLRRSQTPKPNLTTQEKNRISST